MKSSNLGFVDYNICIEEIHFSLESMTKNSNSYKIWQRIKCNGNVSNSIYQVL